MIKLKPRLRMTADMVRCGSRLADIGTDHAYLPAVLILDGTVPSAIAADLRKGPLENADTTVRDNSIEDKVQLRISDGLSFIDSNEVDDIVIAGMGGILIAEILEKAPWVKNEKYKLILQPQSHSEDLRKFLYDNGFEITEEKSCFEDEKVYICMSAIYTGKIVTHTNIEILLGDFAHRTDDASLAYVNKKMKRITARYNALVKNGQSDCEVDKLKKIIDEVK